MPTISKDDLTGFARDLLRAGGYGVHGARQTADMLVWANLRGTESHGVLRIPRYLEMVAEGTIRPDAVPTIIHEKGPIAVIDGGRAPGAVSMNSALAKSADLARRHGLGWCAVRNLTHAGAIGYFGAQLARQGLICIAMSASKPLMTYFGARGEALSTNPLCIAVPNLPGPTPIILDMSTAAVALGKIMEAKDAGTSIPLGWAVDKEGAPTKDPRQVAAVLPMAGAKGSGLSLMIEILASVLIGNPVIAPALAGESSGGMNGIVIAVDPMAFGAGTGFASGVQALAAAIHALRPAPGTASVLLPGERGAQTADERDQVGILIKPGTHRRLTETARKLKIPLPQAFC